MIFVTVSMDLHPFERLISKMDEIAGSIDEEVVIQGCIKYETKHAKYYKCFSREVLEQYLDQARLVVSHAGIGTIMQVLERNKPLIIVPRLKKFNEHHNDHQKEIAEQIRNRKGVRIVYDIEELEDMMDFLENSESNPEGLKALISSIKEFVEEIGASDNKIKC